MALKIWGSDPDAQPKPRPQFADDIAGRFRSGHQLNKRPISLSDWRVTTGDPAVAEKVFDLLGGEPPREWDTTKEDNLEVFSASPEVRILIEKPRDLRERMQLRNSEFKLIQDGDGETVDIFQGEKVPSGTPDPDADLTLAERKRKAELGVGPKPSIEVVFRLADEPDLGRFRYQSGSWGLARQLAGDDVLGQLEDADGPVLATLKLEEVSFEAKTGPRAGQTVTYTASSIVDIEPALVTAE